MEEVKKSRWKSKTHVTLLFWITVFVVGSSVWLKLSLAGDHSGAAISRPAWVTGGRGDGRAVIKKFMLDARFDSCTFEGESADKKATECEPEEARIEVVATIEDISRNVDGLYLSLRASNDFQRWWQANRIKLPREHFALLEPSLSPGRRTQLHDELEAAYVQATTERPPNGQAGGAPTPLDEHDRRVVITTMSAPLKAHFTGTQHNTLNPSPCAGRAWPATGGGTSTANHALTRLRTFVLALRRHWCGRHYRGASPFGIERCLW